MAQKVAFFAPSTQDTHSSDHSSAVTCLCVCVCVRNVRPFTDSTFKNPSVYHDEIYKNDRLTRRDNSTCSHLVDGVVGLPLGLQLSHPCQLVQKLCLASARPTPSGEPALG